MKESFRMCPQKPNHRFAATEYWLYHDECPYCKCKMDLVEIEIVDPKARRHSPRRANRDKDSIGYNRSLLIDSLPRLPWFDEAVDYNEVDQDKSGDIWTLNDAKNLLDLYQEYGESTAEVWNILAMSLGRSLYAVERQLRVIIHHSEELDRHYPPAKEIIKMMDV